MIEFKDPVAEHIKALILDETALEIDNREYRSDPIWRELRDRGSRIWLRGCDKKAAEIWSSDMEAICSDTHELGKAVGRGEHRSLIVEASHLLKGLPSEERTLEIAFIVNARRAIRLSKQFAAKVSVEVPPLPGGAGEMEQYGRRLYQICPEHILLALPFSPEGLRVAKALGEASIPVTINNQFSLGQALRALEEAAPAFLAVSFCREDSQLGPETAEAQQLLKHFADLEPPPDTRLIADGLESPRDIDQLSGFPILLIAPGTAEAYLAAVKRGELPRAEAYEEGDPLRLSRDESRSEGISSRINGERRAAYRALTAEIERTMASI